jgi:hypothetical protein
MLVPMKLLQLPLLPLLPRDGIKQDIFRPLDLGRNCSGCIDIIHIIITIIIMLYLIQNLRERSHNIIIIHSCIHLSTSFISSCQLQGPLDAYIYIYISHTYSYNIKIYYHIYIMLFFKVSRK